MRSLIIRENMKHWGILCASIALNTIVAALICTGLDGSLFH
ncbi:MAG TPA: hypothetical protein VN633_09825 [Bryobacteraceae bacterium]|nr:hypothetical protein [Bryobacteraceae bacterium]